MSESPKLLVLHGPNLNMLGQREPELYGNDTLETINATLQSLASSLKVRINCVQSNHEGEIVEHIQRAAEKHQGLLINAAAYTHTSIAIRDAIIASGLPCVEVHLSNVYRREPFRHHSMLADRCIGVISGFGTQSYTLGLRALVQHLQTALDLL